MLINDFIDLMIDINIVEIYDLNNDKTLFHEYVSDSYDIPENLLYQEVLSFSPDVDKKGNAYISFNIEIE